MSKIHVTCAIVEYENLVLAVQRGEKMSLPLKWEFPGGKIEKGESEQECILREIKEELNIEIELIRKLTPSICEYPNFSIELIPFIAKQIGGKVQLIEHANYKYLEKDKLPSLDWADADISIVKEYLAL